MTCSMCNTSNLLIGGSIISKVSDRQKRSWVEFRDSGWGIDRCFSFTSRASLQLSSLSPFSLKQSLRDLFCTLQPLCRRLTPSSSCRVSREQVPVPCRTDRTVKYPSCATRMALALICNMALDISSRTCITKQDVNASGAEHQHQHRHRHHTGPDLHKSCHRRRQHQGFKEQWNSRDVCACDFTSNC